MKHFAEALGMIAFFTLIAFMYAVEKGVWIFAKACQ